MENSKFPSSVRTDDEKKRWADEYMNRLGIKIDWKNVKFNSGI